MILKIFRKKKSLYESMIPDCPFCGGEPKLTRCGDQRQYWVYLCSVCSVTPVALDEARITPNGAMKMWEIRVRDARRILSTAEYVKRELEKKEVQK